jgi:tetratricopeptide (TPR) repeat protein
VQSAACRVAIVLAIVVRVASAAPIDDLASDDPKAVAAAVAAIESAPPDADALFAAARACEDELFDPARAAALYDRVARELPDSSAAIPSRRRAEQLHALLGPHNEYAAQTQKFYATMGHADDDPAAAVRVIDELAQTSWPGAPDALLWAADVLRERGRYDEALARFDAVHRRWPSSPQGIDSLRGAAGTALEAHQWARARAYAEELPGGNPIEDAARDELIASARQGERRETIGLATWLALGLALLVLLASLADAALRGGWKRPRLRPPVEVMFLAPIAALVTGIAFATQRVIAPAIARITVTGVVLAWLSGAALDLLRQRNRSTRGRSLVHVVACALGVLATAYLAIVAGGLLDILIDQ